MRNGRMQIQVRKCPQLFRDACAPQGSRSVQDLIQCRYGWRGLLPQTCPNDLPCARQFNPVRIDLQIQAHTGIRGNDRSRAEFAHDVHRQVIHDPAIDVQIPAERQRRPDTRDRYRCPHPHPYRTRAVHFQPRPAQIGGHTEIRHPQVFNVQVTEHPLQHIYDFLSPDEGYERQRIIPQRLKIDPPFAIERDHCIRLHPHGVLCRDHRAHTDAPDGIDRDIRLLDGADDTDMCEPPCAPTAEYEADGRSGKIARKACEIRISVHADMEHTRPGTACHVSAGFAGNGLLTCMDDDHMHQFGFTFVGDGGDQPVDGTGLRGSITGIQQHHTIGLTQTALRPESGSDIGHIEHKPVLLFHTVEPLHKTVVRRVQRRVRNPLADLPVDTRSVQHDRATVGFQCTRHSIHPCAYRNIRLHGNHGDCTDVRMRHPTGDRAA